MTESFLSGRLGHHLQERDMKKMFLVFVLLMSSAFADDAKISQTLMEEWNRFRTLVDTLKADGDIAEYMLYKKYGDMDLLWRTSDDENDNQTIRFFMKKRNGDVFAVTYHLSVNVIVDGRRVIRRFIGPEPSGWINHTIDYDTKEYYGQQGWKPFLSAKEKKLLKDWGITFF